MSDLESAILDRRAMLARQRLRDAFVRSKVDATDAAKPATIVRAYPVATLGWAFAAALAVGTRLRSGRPAPAPESAGDANAESTQSKKSRFAAHPVLASLQGAALLAAASARQFLIRQFMDAWQGGADLVADEEDVLSHAPSSKRRLPFE